MKNARYLRLYIIFIAIMLSIVGNYSYLFAEVLRPIGYIDFSGNTINEIYAIDGDGNTYTSVPTNVDASPSIIYNNWQNPSGVYDSLELIVTRSSTGNVDDKWGIKYSTDGGNTWMTLDSMSSENDGEADILINLDSSQDFSQLQVRIDTDKKKNADSGEVHIFDIRTEGVIASMPTLSQSAYRFFEYNASSEFYARVSDEPGADAANAIALDGDYIFTAGYMLGDWYVDKRYKDGGSLACPECLVTMDDSWGEVNAIAIVGCHLYLVGDDYWDGDYRWRIQKLDLDLDPVTTFGTDGVVYIDPSDNNDSPYGIASHGSNIYVVGSDRSYGEMDAQWLIVALDHSTGAVQEEIAINPSSDNDIANAIAIDDCNPDDGSAGYCMYVVGYDRMPGSSSKPGKSKKGTSNEEWGIYKKSLQGSSIEQYESYNPGFGTDIATGIATDGEYAYIIGYESAESSYFDPLWRIEKRDLNTLTLVPSFGDNGVIRENYAPSYDDQPTAIAIDGNFLYAVGYSCDAGDGGDAAWHYLKISLADGTLQYEVVNDIDPDRSDRANAIAIDDTYMYVAGFYDPGVPDMRVARRELSDLSTDLLEDLSPLGYPDTCVSLPYGNAFRLRMLVHVEDSALPQNLLQFKLQYALESTAGVCAGLPDSSYNDVSDETSIAFKDNPLAFDGNLITAHDDDPQHDGDETFRQTYEEQNGFTNSVSTIPVGSDGMWDFSLEATDSGTYCIRIVKDDGTPLNFYDIYPEVVVTPP